MVGCERRVGSTTASVGELCHSHDTSRGGLMRESGFPAFGAELPAWRLTGIESVGDGTVPASFQVSQSGHRFFNEPEFVGLANVNGACTLTIMLDVDPHFDGKN